MKKSVFFLLCVFFALYSCKKNTTKPASQQKTYHVNFNLSGFTQTLVSLSTNRHVNHFNTTRPTSALPGVNILYYAVYDANQTRIHFLEQDSTASNFGIISDNLPAGTYTVVVAAGKLGLHYVDVDNYLNYASSQNSDYWQDTFFSKFQLTVSGNVNQNITLTRMVAQLEIDIVDAIPASAKSFSVSVNPEYYLFNIFDQTSTIRSAIQLVRTINIPATAIGKSGYKIIDLIGNTITPATVTITAFDTSNNIVATATITNVVFQPNRKTILSGRLFSPNATFNVTLNPWNPNPINTPF